jgi:hypothetical protein
LVGWEDFIITNRLVSLAVLVMLAFVYLGTPVLAQDSAQLGDLLSKLSELTAQKGEDVDVPAAVANALGLTDGDQNWATRQVAAPDSRSGVFHGFAMHSGIEDVLFIGRHPDALHVFRSHRDGKLVAAGAYNILAREVTILDPATAQNELAAEVAFWSQYFASAK